MRWGISVEEPPDAYDGMDNDAAIRKQQDAMDLTTDFAEALGAELNEQLGGDWKVEFNV